MRVSGRSSYTRKDKAKLKIRISDELIDVINVQRQVLITGERYDDLDGLDELVQHSINGFIEIKQKRLPKNEEIDACRQHLDNLKSTMLYMSNISKMTEMSL